MKQQKGFVGIVLLVILGMVSLSLVGMALNIITIPWLKLGSKVQMERDIVTKTFNADNAIYNYHWFKEKAGAIDALSQKIVVADNTVSLFVKESGSRDKWTFEDKQEWARLSSIAQGLRSQKADFVNEYNARMKEADRSKFSEELPLFFSL